MILVKYPRVFLDRSRLDDLLEQVVIINLVREELRTYREVRYMNLIDMTGYSLSGNLVMVSQDGIDTDLVLGHEVIRLL